MAHLKIDDICILCFKCHGYQRHMHSMSLKCWIKWQKLNVDAKIFHSRQLNQMFNDMKRERQLLLRETGVDSGQENTPNSTSPRTDKPSAPLELSA